MKLFIKETEIIRVLETFNGDLYFISESNGDEIFCYARLYSMPEFAEWGYNSLKHLQSNYGRDKIWDVSKQNWSNLLTYNVEGLRLDGT
ncbi:MAG TPA: hypothetical protein VGS11_11840 [Candidatus Bathyarchaeia archaeon]|nr:hypothetical protein [Candidatus Bathyarchaeia archaeon]